MNDCIFCGKQLSEKEETIGCGICIDCQSKHFSKLEEENGCHLAIFICCAAYDIPCKPLLCPIDLVNFDGNRWEKYIDILFENGELGGKTEKTFFSGVCDIRRVFGKNLSESDFARYISVEQERIGKLPGTPEQREKWGMEDGYTSEEYDALDRMYESRLNGFRGQTITEQMIYTLEEVAKWQLVSDKARRASNTKEALDALKAVDNLLASEAMRKKDEKQVENFRPDAWIDAFEKSGLMKDGDFLSISEMQNELIKVMRGKGYKQTLDAAHQLEMNIINNARKNADQPIVYELPEYMEVTDELEEFEKEESEEEKRAKRYAQLSTVRIDKKKQRKPRKKG